MRNVYLVSYDVCNRRRWRKAYRLVCGAGDPVQYSVFRCELSEMEKQALKESLWNVLNWTEDRVMLVNLGPAEGRGDQCIEHWGEPLTRSANRAAVVV